MDACVSVCMWVCVECTHLCGCMQTPETNTGCLLLLSTWFFWDRVSPWAWSSTFQLDQLAIESLSPLLSAGATSPGHVDEGYWWHGTRGASLFDSAWVFTVQIQFLKSGFFTIFCCCWFHSGKQWDLPKVVSLQAENCLYSSWNSDLWALAQVILVVVTWLTFSWLSQHSLEFPSGCIYPAALESGTSTLGLNGAITFNMYLKNQQSKNQTNQPNHDPTNQPTHQQTNKPAQPTYSLTNQWTNLTDLPTNQPTNPPNQPTCPPRNW